MITFTEFVTPEAIINVLCKYRVKLADARHKEHILMGLTPDEKSGVISKPELEAMLPPRRQWPTLTKENRYHKNFFNQEQALSSKDVNTKRLKLAIRKAYEEGSSEEWFVRLQNFIDDVRNACSDDSFMFDSP